MVAHAASQGLALLRFHVCLLLLQGLQQTTQHSREGGVTGGTPKQGAE
jgi:hypothetical protein